MTKQEFMTQWGVSGMPADKIKLANAAWDAAVDMSCAAATYWARQYIIEDGSPISVEEAIREV